MDDRPAIAVVYQLIEDGVPVLAGLMHREPFRPGQCRHDARIPADVIARPLPAWWDGWLDLGDGWFAAGIDLEPALLAAMLVGADDKDQIRTCSRRAVERIVAEADAVLKVPASGDDRHNPDLDDIFAA
jgi:hypothetical protein